MYLRLFHLFGLRHGERLVHLRDGAFVQVLRPGKHVVPTIWGVHEFRKVDLVSPIEAIESHDPLPEVLPDARVETVGPTEVAVALARGVPFQVLRAGRYRIWDPDGAITVHRWNAWAEPEPLADDDQLPEAGMPWREILVERSRAMVLTRHARPVRRLAPGRYRLATAGPWTVVPVPTELQELEVAAQDLLTADRVPVRVVPVAALRVVDPLAWLESGQPLTLVYRAVQLALRAVLGTHTLETLLAERGALDAEVLAAARANLPEAGAVLEMAAIRDVILGADVKAQFNKVIVARKEAEALAIRRKEEVAQTRQLANTARVLSSNPILLRLKELEHVRDIAGQVDRITVVGGGELMGRVWLNGLTDEA